MSEMVKLLAVAGSSLLAGGVIGSYATSALLGGRETVTPGSKAVLAAAAAEPVECNCDSPSTTRVAPVAGPARLPEGLREIDQPTLPGLPVSALNQARAEAQRQLAECTSSEDAVGQGTLVLTMTVTATGGQGFVSEVDITAQSGEVEWAEDCVLQQARRVRFEWSGGDGQQTLKIPLRVGDD